MGNNFCGLIFPQEIKKKKKEKHLEESVVVTFPVLCLYMTSYKYLLKTAFLGKPFPGKFQVEWLFYWNSLSSPSKYRIPDMSRVIGNY